MGYPISSDKFLGEQGSYVDVVIGAEVVTMLYCRMIKIMQQILILQLMMDSRS